MVAYLSNIVELYADNSFINLSKIMYKYKTVEFVYYFFFIVHAQ